MPPFLSICAVVASLLSADAIESSIMRSESYGQPTPQKITKHEVAASDDAVSEIEDDEENESEADLTKEEIEALDLENEERAKKEENGEEYFDDVNGEDEDGAHPGDADDESDGSLLETRSDGDEDAEDGEMLEQEDNEDTEQSDADGEWKHDVHYIPASKLNELAEIKKNGTEISTEQLLEMISEDNFAKLPENETLVAVKMSEPEEVENMDVAEFIEKKTPHGFIDMILKGRLNESSPEAKPMKLVEYQNRHEHEREGDQEEEDVHFLPGSAFDALVDMYNKKSDNATRQEISSLISEEHIETLPDSENVVAFKMEFLTGELPDLLNSTTPKVFLEKIIAGQKSFHHPKNISLGQLRKFQANADQEGASAEEEDEHSKEDQGASEAQEDEEGDAGGKKDGDDAGESRDDKQSSEKKTEKSTGDAERQKAADNDGTDDKKETAATF